MAAELRLGSSLVLNQPCAVSVLPKHCLQIVGAMDIETLDLSNNSIQVRVTGPCHPQLVRRWWPLAFLSTPTYMATRYLHKLTRSTLPLPAGSARSSLCYLTAAHRCQSEWQSTGGSAKGAGTMLVSVEPIEPPQPRACSQAGAVP